MAANPQDELKPVGGGATVWLKATTWNAIVKILRRPQLEPDPAQFDVNERAGKRQFRLRSQPVPDSRGGSRLRQFEVYAINQEDATCLVQKGWVLAIDPALAASPVMIYLLPTVGAGADPMATTPLAISAAHVIYCKVTTTALDLATVATGAEIVSLSSTPTDVHAQPVVNDVDGAEYTAEVPGVYHYKIASFIEADGILKVDDQFQDGGPIIHRPGRTGQTFAITFQDCGTANVTRLDFTQGEASSQAGATTIETGCDGAGTGS